MKGMIKQKDSARLAAHMFVIGRLMKEGFQKRTAGAKPVCSLLHLQTLRYVKEHKNPLMSDVAKFLFVTPPAATLLINGLVKEGVLARVIDARDRRAVRLRVTRTGNGVLIRNSREAKNQIAEIFSVLDAKEMATFEAILEKVAKTK